MQYRDQEPPKGHYMPTTTTWTYQEYNEWLIAAEYAADAADFEEAVEGDADTY